MRGSFRVAVVLTVPVPAVGHLAGRTFAWEPASR